MAVKKNNKRASDILKFWFDETPPDHWFNGGNAFDALLRRRFSMDVQRALGGHYDGWARTPDSRLALILLLDQMTRNLYRGSGDAFAGDDKALVFSLMAVDSGQLDEEADERRRGFLLMPLMHS